MSDLIDRQAAIAEFNCCELTPDGGIDVNYAIDFLKQLPSAQPERKKGRWINAYPDIEPNPMFMYGICSVCGYEQAISDKLNFCPNCGADMRGKEE